MHSFRLCKSFTVSACAAAVLLAFASSEAFARVRLENICTVYRIDSPVDFIAQVLEISMEDPQTQARVVINAKTQTVIVTGEVQISPVLVSAKGLSVQVGGGDTPTDSFRVLIDKESRQSTTQLRELVEALNQLQVPTSDVIEILREIHRSGKLHAVFDDH